MSSGPGKGSKGQLQKQLMKTRPAQPAHTKRMVTKGFSSPAQQTEFTWPIFVHDNAQGESDGAQQEGSHSEGQVQHLVLILTDGPAIHFQVLLLGTRPTTLLRVVIPFCRRDRLAVVQHRHVPCMDRNNKSLSGTETQLWGGGD
ncbi:hypothetical protein COCON_G00185680 [Conger conger]|uniref:Uncharacterized protein n=1 Tax=Conger conger TaxID=82655 RepID=A0A9Q1D246_CONCO|nr:hypothetical protein COCON_G00185680 [Conger conger]